LDVSHHLEKLPTTARWLLFVPGAIFAAFLVSVPVELLDRVYPWSASDWLSYVLLVPAGWAAITFAFVVVGAIIAPANRGIIASALALFAVSIVLLDIDGTVNGFSTFTSPVEATLSDVGMIIGLTAGLILIFRKLRRAQSTPKATEQ
jgi:hypothetical protein